MLVLVHYFFFFSITSFTAHKWYHCIIPDWVDFFLIRSSCLRSCFLKLFPKNLALWHPNVLNIGLIPLHSSLESKTEEYKPSFRIFLKQYTNLRHFFHITAFDDLLLFCVLLCVHFLSSFSSDKSCKLLINSLFISKERPVWLNGWVFVYELSGGGSESRCSRLKFRYRACFKQGIPWRLGNYRV